MNKLYLVLPAILLCLGCNKKDITLDSTYNIQIVSGDNQTDTTGNTLKSPIVINALRNGRQFDNYYLKFETAACYTNDDDLYKVAIPHNLNYDWELNATPGKQLLKVILFDENKNKRDSAYVTANAIDAGAGWHSSSCVLNATPTDLAYLPNGTILSGSLSRNRLLQSTNNGISWMPFHSFKASGQISQILPLSSKEIFLSTVDKGILFSSDSGKTWSPRTPPQSPTKTFGQLRLTRSGILFASAVWDGIYYSDNNGGSWQKSNFQDVGYTNFKYPNSQSNGDLYAICDIALVLSKDNGKTWMKSNIAGDGYRLSSIFIDTDDAIYLGVYNYTSKKIEIIVSRNNGLSWQSVFSIPVARGGSVYIGEIKKQFGFYSFYVSRHGIIKTSDFRSFEILSSENTQDGVHYVFTPDNWVVTYNQQRGGLIYFKP
jgi:photosystem II stability/assembly factor-like uncharacterized protein